MGPSCGVLHGHLSSKASSRQHAGEWLEGMTAKIPREEAPEGVQVCTRIQSSTSTQHVPLKTGSVSRSISWLPSYGYLNRSMVASTRLCKTALMCHCLDAHPHHRCHAMLPRLLLSRLTGSSRVLSDSLLLLKFVCVCFPVPPRKARYSVHPFAHLVDQGLLHEYNKA